MFQHCSNFLRFQSFGGSVDGATVHYSLVFIPVFVLSFIASQPKHADYWKDKSSNCFRAFSGIFKGFRGFKKGFIMVFTRVYRVFKGLMGFKAFKRFSRGFHGFFQGF